MGEALQQRAAPEAGDFYLLAYAQHMAVTARSEPARRLFEEYVEQERRRLETREVSGHQSLAERKA